MHSKGFIVVFLIENHGVGHLSFNYNNPLQVDYHSIKTLPVIAKNVVVISVTQQIAIEAVCIPLILAFTASNSKTCSVTPICYY